MDDGSVRLARVRIHRIPNLRKGNIEVVSWLEMGMHRGNTQSSSGLRYSTLETQGHVVSII